MLAPNSRRVRPSRFIGTRLVPEMRDGRGLTTSGRGGQAEHWNEENREAERIEYHKEHGETTISKEASFPL